MTNSAHVTTRGGPYPDVSAAVLRRRAMKMLRELGATKAELSIALVGDDAIHELNRAWRKKDKPTDVLAFPLQEVERGARPTGMLGDVILSVETTRRQAKARRRPVLDEATMLLAHGLLHLVGYDHRDDAEEREMTEKTRLLEAVAKARVPRHRKKAGKQA